MLKIKKNANFAGKWLLGLRMWNFQGKIFK